MVLPFSEAMSVTVSPPFSTIYSTPSVPAASSTTPPSVWLYRMAATLARHRQHIQLALHQLGRQLIGAGRDGVRIRVLAQAVVRIVKQLYHAHGGRALQPAQPHSDRLAADLSPSSMGIGVFGVTQAHSVNASASASSRDTFFSCCFLLSRDTVSYTKLSCSMPICLLSV